MMLSFYIYIKKKPFYIEMDSNFTDTLYIYLGTYFIDDNFDNLLTFLDFFGPGFPTRTKSTQKRSVYMYPKMTNRNVNSIFSAKQHAHHFRVTLVPHV